ncbi:glycogen/starch synthase [Spongiivirga sp. MCCC 1A20706]|uniref:glycogen synthase n=1 Tax=Spongiivirga sp. MCCC 1A20706 TaxID=3160963 RepID=UPI0039774337
MKILHFSAECYPLAKVGGLADVVGALPNYQNKSGVDASVIMPFYQTKVVAKLKTKTVFKHAVKVGINTYDYSVEKIGKRRFGFSIYLLKIKGLTDREQVYGYDDDYLRFLTYQIAALHWIVEEKLKLDLVHIHDHHTGLIPFMMGYCKQFKDLNHIPTVLTIHNAQYQGQFGYDKFNLLPDFDQQHAGLLDWYGCINPLAAAVKCAWRVTTVSPSYMEEMARHANGLEGLLAHEKAKCSGIINGIDWNTWNPETDALLPKDYTHATVQSGKKASKKSLCDEFGLDVSKPLFIFIGRLVWEKGADLLPDIFKQVLMSERNNGNFLVLGSGNTEIEEQFNILAQEFKGIFNNHTGYNEALSHRMYAGGDFLLMPSRVEPCGLNQLYSMRYGTIPVVNNIGGLKDTIIDIEETNGFGIKHHEVSVVAVGNAIFRAQALFENKEEFKKNRKKIMKIDHSWDHSVKQYIHLYKSLTQSKNGQ